METRNISSPERCAQGIPSRRLKTACVIQLLALLVAWLPAVAQAQFDYTTDNGTITLTAYSGPGGVVVIPATINGLPVIRINEMAFASSTSVTRVTIPDSVTSIGAFAFVDCTSLVTVTIPNSVISIGNNAFEFCTSLTHVAIPSSVTSFGEAAFNYCFSLGNVTIENGVTSIGAAAFTQCFSLAHVTIPSSVTNIGNFAFYDCISLASLTIGGGLTSIGGDAFTGCTSLTSVTIPSSVTSIGRSAFVGCTSLAAITVEAENSTYGSLDGVLFDESLTTLVLCPGGKAGNYTVPSSVSSIAYGAFYGCTSLASVTVGSGVYSIENFAFLGCTSLANITLPNSLTSIGNGAFFGCTSLMSITIPIGVTSIGDVAFAYCTSLSRIHFEGNAPSVGSSVSEGDIAATVYYLPGTTGWGPTFGGRPAALWLPQVSTGDASFGVRTNQFGFNINWASGRTVVVEACEDLANPVWTPAGTNTLAEGSSYFSDPQWTNSPARFYRLREQ